MQVYVKEWSLFQKVRNLQINTRVQEHRVISDKYLTNQSFNYPRQRNNHMDEQQSYNYEDGDYGQYEDYRGDDYDYEYDNEYYIQEEDNFNNYSSTGKDYEVLPFNDLFAEVIKHLKTAQEMTALSEGWCLLLLREFKWDTDLLPDYFQDMDKYRTKIGYKPSYKLPNHIQTHNDTCEVCCEQSLLYNNICDHGFCQNCWKSHLQANILANNPFLKCMDCQCPILHETMLTLLRDFYPQSRKLLEQYEKCISELFSTIHRNYQFCTGVDCVNCIKVHNLNIRNVKCTCGKVFCFKCKSDDHSPCSCEDKKQWLQNVLKEEADAKWMAVNTKLCPWCKKAVERSAGCNYMACVCKKSFCYLCSRPWEPDHKDHFKCHIYKKSAAQTVNREKQILNKMNFFTERFLDNQATAVNNKKIDTFKLRKLLFDVLKIDLSDSEFIDTAYKFSIECCECLKWIYAYSYYVKWANDIQKECFEFNQGEFEKYKANLLKFLAIDLKNYLKKVEEIGQMTEADKYKIWDAMLIEFKNLKKDIVNYFTMTKKYKDKFIEQLENRNEEVPSSLGNKKSSKPKTVKKQSSKPQGEVNTEKKQNPKQQKQSKQETSKMITRSKASKQESEVPKTSKQGWFGKYLP